MRDTLRFVFSCVFHEVERFSCDCVLQITPRPYEAYLHQETDFECLYGDEIEYEMEDSIKNNIQYEEGELAVFKCRPMQVHGWHTADAAIRKVILRKAFMHRTKAKAKRDKKNIC